MRNFLFLFFSLILLISTFPQPMRAETDQQELHRKRMELYKRIEQVTHIPWNYIAAVDQYERNIRAVRKDLPKPTGLVGIYFPQETWAGRLNPNPDDKNPLSIQIFGGIGKDGDGDNIADPTNDMDVLYTFTDYILQYGTDHEQIKIGLWEYYKQDKAVSIISNYAKIYKTFQTLALDEHFFPCLFTPTIVIAVLGETPVAGVVEEFMKAQIFSLDMVLMFTLHVTELSK